MRRCRYLLVCAVILAAALPAPAGIFGKKKKPDPVQRVPELIQILQAEKDDRKRAAAAEELRQFDPAQFPQIVPTLVEVLKTDPKGNVRLEAVHTLGKLRPVSQQAGQAMEKAAGADASLRVRVQARTSLMFYHMAGYSAAKKAEPPPPPARGPRTDEPPLAVPNPAPPTAQTPPPPLAPSTTEAPPPATEPGPSLYRPLPSTPSQAPPVQPSASAPELDGPILTPPP